MSEEKNIVIAPEEAQVMDQHTIEANALLAVAEDMAVVTDAESEAKAVAFGGQVKAKRKAIDDARKILVRPYNDRVDLLNGEFKKILEPLDQVEKIVKAGIMKHRDSEAMKAAEEERKRLEIEKAKHVATAPAELAKVEAVVPKMVTTAKGQARFREDKKFEVVDADLVAREFCSPDPKKIDKAVKALTIEQIKAGVEVPGLRIYVEKVPLFYGV